MTDDTLKDVVNKSSGSMNSTSAESRPNLEGCGLKALPSPADTPMNASEYVLIAPHAHLPPGMWRIILHRGTVMTIGDDIYFRIARSELTDFQDSPENIPVAEPEPVPYFRNPYIRKGMLTPNPGWERQVWSGEIDRLYRVKSKELVTKLPSTLVNGSYAFTRPHYFIDLYCLRVAMALRLKVLGDRNRVLSEFSHACIHRDEWQDLNCPAAYTLCDRCKTCPSRDDCADVFWDEC